MQTENKVALQKIIFNKKFKQRTHSHQICLTRHLRKEVKSQSKHPKNQLLEGSSFTTHVLDNNENNRKQMNMKFSFSS